MSLTNTFHFGGVYVTRKDQMRLLTLGISIEIMLRFFFSQCPCVHNKFIAIKYQIIKLSKLGKGL